MSAITHERGVNATLVKLYIRDRFGEEGVKKVSARLNPDSREMFFNVVSNKWFPVELMNEIYEALDREFGKENPDLYRDYGRFEVDRSIKGFLKFLVRNLMSVEQLLKRTQAFWKNYHKGGVLETSSIWEDKGLKHVTVSIEKFNLYPKVCSELEGFMEGLVLRTGASNVSIEEKSCIHKGDKNCSWEVSWK
ncbi:hypothetical protein JXM67_02930 [candidate division WOR-3 bacterium]|nr:hypothetical protein [candidate division WOR-3 bacterium]